MAGVVLERVSRVYPGGVAAVDGLDLEVGQGECVALVGPSGCGKTTTLRLIAGLESPQQGTIRIGDRVVNAMPVRKRNVALVFQDAVLFPHWTVERNLAEAASGGRHSPSDARGAYLHRVVGMLGLASLLQRFPAELSGGERQRAALARGLMKPGELLLLDEPLANVDAGLREELRDVLRRLIEERKITTVLVTHDQADALALGDRVGVMRAGRMEQIGEPGELFDAPRTRFVAEFVGEPRINFARVALVAQGEEMSLSWRGAEWPLPAELAARLRAYGGQAVCCGVRPERVQIGRERSELSSPSGSDVSVSAVMERVTFLGTRRVVAARPLGGAESDLWRVCVREGCAARPGEEVRLSFNPRLAVWFDPTTGLAVGSREA